MAFYKSSKRVKVEAYDKCLLTKTGILDKTFLLPVCAKIYFIEQKPETKWNNLKQHWAYSLSVLAFVTFEGTRKEG